MVGTLQKLRGAVRRLLGTLGSRDRARTLQAASEPLHGPEHIYPQCWCCPSPRPGELELWNRGVLTRARTPPHRNLAREPLPTANHRRRLELELWNLGHQNPTELLRNIELLGGLYDS